MWAESRLLVVALGIFKDFQTKTLVMVSDTEVAF